MADKNVIETGVDRLVRLVRERSRIAVDDAARVLGFDQNIIMEWALFLEEEGILNVEYKLTKTFLVSRILTKKEISQKVKDVESKKEVVLRKASMLKSLIERETSGFEKLSKEFIAMQQEVSKEAGVLEKDLQMYEHLKQQKEDLDSKIRKSREEMTAAVEGIGFAIAKDQAEYLKVLHQLQIEEASLKKIVENSTQVVFTEQALKKQMGSLRGSLRRLEEHLRTEDADMRVTQERVYESKKHLQALKTDIIRRQKQALKGLEERSKRLVREVDGAAKSMLAKLAGIRQDEARFEGKLKKHARVYDLLKEKGRLEKTFEDIKVDNEVLNKEVDELIKKIHIAKVSSLGKVEFDEAVIKRETDKVSEHVESFQERLKNLMHFGSFFLMGKKTGQKEAAKPKQAKIQTKMKSGKKASKRKHNKNITIRKHNNKKVSV
ncbi:hypothetical protein HZB03_01265 [Candidatus Woesearchaeota archaeon]|nr:hypothetical protein [Candidatus Woesearchaeota archaeon]